MRIAANAVRAILRTGGVVLVAEREKEREREREREKGREGGDTSRENEATRERQGVCYVRRRDSVGIFICPPRMGGSLRGRRVARGNAGGATVRDGPLVSNNMRAV